MIPLLVELMPYQVAAHSGARDRALCNTKHLSSDISIYKGRAMPDLELAEFWVETFTIYLMYAEL